MGTQRSSSRKVVSPRRQGKQVEATQRQVEPARGEPPVPLTDDLEELVAPPLAAKTHPREDMDEVKPSLDDESRRHRHHPNDAGTTRFSVDPEAADAAADLAGDLGSSFLEGATRGEDLSEVEIELEERQDSELPFLIEEEGDGGSEDASEEEEEEP